MAREFKLPELAENVTAAEIVKVMVSAGDRIEIDQTVLELETDKATAEVPSDTAGVVTKVHVKEGDKVAVGQTVLTIDEAEGTGAEAAETPEAELGQAASSSPSAESEGETEKPVAPAEQMESAPVTMADLTEEPEHIPAPPAIEPKRRDDRIPVPASPAVRRFAHEVGLEVEDVQGTGPHGRVSIDDIKRHLKSANQQRRVVLCDSQIKGFPLPDFESFGEVERAELTAIRRTISERMAWAWRQIPHVTQFDVADISEVEDARKRMASRVEKEGGKLTMTVIVARLLAEALKNFPNFNASLDAATQQLIYKKYYNIGIAVDTDRGLLVPVVRDVDKKTLPEIAVAIGEVADLARTGKARAEHLSGGTFTITNLGGIGGTHFTPIINWPEVAILGIGRAYKALSPDDPTGPPRLILPLSLSYDHRVIDGADGIRFLRWIVNALEEPLSMWM